jgi:hypothetical protein
MEEPKGTSRLKRAVKAVVPLFALAGIAALVRLRKPAPPPRRFRLSFH